MSNGYAGDLTVAQTWERLAEDTNAVLVDVRTIAEWNYVGVPDLSELDKKPVLIQWQNFPDGQLNPHFLEELEQAGIGKEQPVLLLCRSGARSRSAAQLMTQNGWREAYNIADGFEGPHDGNRHRGGIAGWKSEGLPWTQG